MKPEELGAWQALLQEEFEKPYWQTLSERVDTAYAASAVYPPREALFAAFRLTPPEAVRAVILGQDPYHEPGQANGLAFSVRPGVKLPPSLRNIFAELQSDCDITPPDSGDLTTWARQGVFLLNSSLSVEAGKAASHQAFGWQTFTDAAVRAVAALPQPVAFVLWGGQAQKKQSFLQGVAVLTAATIIVKLLGFIYKVPLQNILQERGFGYFNTAYDVYNLSLIHI